MAGAQRVGVCQLWLLELIVQHGEARVPLAPLGHACAAADRTRASVRAPDPSPLTRRLTLTQTLTQTLTLALTLTLTPDSSPLTRRLDLPLFSR